MFKSLFSFVSKSSLLGLLFFFYFLSFVHAQTLSSSRVYVQTNYHKEVCFSFSSDAVLAYNANSQELSFTIDFATFKVGVDSLDEWLMDLSDSKLKFVSHITEDQFPPATNNASRLFHLNGDLTMNGKSNKHKIDVVIFTVSDQNIQTKSSGNNIFDRMRVHLSIAFLPKEFGVDKRPHHLSKSIIVKVADGFINYVRQ
ncbi:MAG: YceI family protein [Bacteroidota bacterium]|jgi:polyisoprenoid-binding protein YceI